MALQHLRSSTANKRPTPAVMADGQLAMNTETNSPGLFFKNSGGTLVKIGPVHVGTTAPNATPGTGGQAGNSVGEQWLDTSSSRYVFKIWDGTAWRSEDGEFVNASGDTMTGALVMDNQQQVRFRETTVNGTNYIALQAPASVASDKTITLPDVTGTVVTTGDTGTVTSTMLLNGTLLNADVNASAAIAGTKISPDFGSQNTTTTGTDTAASFNPTSATVPTDGLYKPGTNQLAISTNGVQRLLASTGAIIIPSTNSLLVGQNTNPSSYTFIANSNSSANVVSLSNNVDSGLNINLSGGVSSIDASTGVLGLRTSGTERLRITSGGLVGIGTSSPLALTHISSTFGSSLTTGLRIDGLGATTDNFAPISFWTQSSDWGTNPAANIACGQLSGVNGGGYLRFSTSPDGNTAPQERLRITATGNVGIGTTGPGSLLELSGSGSASEFRLRSTDTTNTIIRAYVNALEAGKIAFTSGRDLFIETAGTERARIDSSGRLLVGTSSSSASAAAVLQGFAGSPTGQGILQLQVGKNNAATGVNENLGSLRFANNEGNIGALVSGEADLQWNSGDYPSRLVFSTTADGASSPTERMRIDSAGAVTIATGDATIYGVRVGRGAGAISSNTAVGSGALNANTTGTQNNAIGVNALYSNTTGTQNTAIGLNALLYNTTGSTNTANGVNALFSNTTGSTNTAIGLNALFSNTTGSSNNAIGFSALFSNTTGSTNTAIGIEAGYGDGTQANTTGGNNAFIGFDAMGASATASNVITLGNASIATLRCQVTTITSLSDERDKTNITNLGAGLDFISKLRPVSFTWNTRDGKKVGAKDAGFIAQELLLAQDETKITIPNLVSQENPDRLEAGYGTLIPVLVNAVQELTAMVKQLQDEITILKGDN